MIGFRILAVVLALICLAGAAIMVFPERQPAILISGFFLNPELSEFLQSQEPRDITVREHLKYLFLMGAVGAFGLAILFFISAVNPLAMRPFLVALIICLIIGIAAAFWQGTKNIHLTLTWWLADAIGGVILVILLITFFPRRSPPPPPLEEKVGTE